MKLFLTLLAVCTGATLAQAGHCGVVTTGTVGVPVYSSPIQIQQVQQPVAISYAAPQQQFQLQAAPSCVAVQTQQQFAAPQMSYSYQAAPVAVAVGVPVQYAQPVAIRTFAVAQPPVYQQQFVGVPQQRFAVGNGGYGYGGGSFAQQQRFGGGRGGFVAGSGGGNGNFQRTLDTLFDPQVLGAVGGSIAGASIAGPGGKVLGGAIGSGIGSILGGLIKGR